MKKKTATHTERFFCRELSGALIGAQHCEMLCLTAAALSAYVGYGAPSRLRQPAAARAAPPRLGWLGGAPGLTDEAAMVRAREEGLVGWLGENDVYLSPQSTWGRAGHPLRVESDTSDDFEPSGRGLIARRPVNQNEPLLGVRGVRFSICNVEVAPASGESPRGPTRADSHERVPLLLAIVAHQA